MHSEVNVMQLSPLKLQIFTLKWINLNKGLSEVRLHTKATDTVALCRLPNTLNTPNYMYLPVIDCAQVVTGRWSK